ncbi:MAG: hypothetical protein PHT69_15305 [Bacteroidales bacterium]|nr:hypothetical protein [Bacteroidales bacterium]
MKSINLKNVYPHVVAVLIFIAISLIYLSPLLEGKKLKMTDSINYEGMSKEISDFKKASGEDAMWTNSMFGGMPAFQITINYTKSVTKYVFDFFRAVFPHPADILFLYLLGFYILMLVIGANPWLAIVGAIAYTFSSYHFIVIEAGHISKAYALAYMAPVLAGIILTLRGKLISGGSLTALFLALHIWSNHLQITYYFLFILLFWGLAEAIRLIKQNQFKDLLKSVAVLFIAVIIAIGVNFNHLWTTYAYTKNTTRGPSELTSNKENKTSGLDKDYATQWSYGVAESFSLMIPNIKGGSSGAFLYEELVNLNQGNAREKAKAKKIIDNYSPELVNYVKQGLMSGKYVNTYWGDQPFTSGPVYAGSIIIFLFVLSFFLLKGNLKWFILAVTILSIMLGWGKNFMSFTDFFLDYFPGYNKFRAVSMTLIIAEFCIPLLAFMGLNQLLRKPEIFSKSQRNLYIAFGLTGGLALIFYVMPSTFFSFFSNAEYSSGTSSMSELESARISIFRAETLRTFIYIALAFGAIFLFSLKKINNYILVAVLGVLVLTDMWTVNKRYLNSENFVQARDVDIPFRPNAANLQILQDSDPNFRVFNADGNPFNESATSYFHKSLGGYHGAKLKRYQDIIDYHLGGRGNLNMNVINMLNTKYVIKNIEGRGPMALSNPDALGNAWFVRDVKMVNNADEEILALDDFDPKITAIVDKRFSNQVENLSLSEDSMAFITLTSYQPNKLVYKSSSASKQLAVFSEIYYPDGWEVSINGTSAPHFRANYILRALVIPEGVNEIVFEFKPKSFYLGENISFAFSILLVISLLVSLYYNFFLIKSESKTDIDA